MKRILTTFLISLFPFTLNAKTIDQEGRRWITANDVKIEYKTKMTKEQMRDYVMLDNNIKYCYFNEIWKNPQKENEYLEKWSSDENDRFRFNLFFRIYYRLPYANLPEDIINQMTEGVVHDEYKVKALDNIRKKYERKTSIKSQKECQKIGEYVEELLTK